MEIVIIGNHLIRKRMDLDKDILTWTLTKRCDWAVETPDATSMTFNTNLEPFEDGKGANAFFLEEYN
jgi:hypothetical protein